MSSNKNYYLYPNSVSNINNNSTQITSTKNNNSLNSNNIISNSDPDISNIQNLKNNTNLNNQSNMANNQLNNLNSNMNNNNPYNALTLNPTNNTNSSVSNNNIINNNYNSNYTISNTMNHYNAINIGTGANNLTNVNQMGNNYGVMLHNNLLQGNGIPGNTGSTQIIRLSVLLEKSRWFNVYKKTKRLKTINYNLNTMNASVNTTTNNYETERQSQNNSYSLNNKSNSLINSTNKEILFYSGDSPIKRWGHTAVTYQQSKMIVFGGRYHYKSLGTIYMFDPTILEWLKIEPEINIAPCPRDSHSCLMFNDEMYIFGGNWQEKKLNDFWKFNFQEKKWTKINAQNGPGPIEGHVTCLVSGKLFMVQGGLDESNKVTSNLFLFDLINSKWHACNVSKEYEKYASRECRSCVSNGDFCYLFGGEVRKNLKLN
jgi:hypothetical protein